MRLLLFSDLHCDAAAARRLVDIAAGVDLVVGAGDFATCRRGIATTIDVLRAIRCPAVLVPGNSETYEELALACAEWPTAVVLHGQAATILGVPFFGLGGAVPVTPFGAWSFDLTEEVATGLLAACPADAVLVTHSPPLGAVDQDSHGRHLGSRAVLEAIRQFRPRLVVCGHIHASGGQTSKIDGTQIINAGPQGVCFAWARSGTDQNNFGV